MIAAGVSLILGGTRSGKTKHAERLALRSGRPAVYAATYPLRDDVEMQARVAAHQQSRNQAFHTREGCYDLRALATEHPGACIVLDCLIMWLLVRGEGIGPGQYPDLLKELEAMLQATQTQVRWVIVSSEIGLGVLPLGRETREFCDLAGSAHQMVAGLADSVELIVAGLPLSLKSREYSML